MTPAGTLATTAPIASRCTRLGAPTEPLSREELEHGAAPASVEAARDLLLGVWDGHRFSLDGELGQPGGDPRAEDDRVVCFDAGGRMPDPASREDEHAPGAGCTARSRTYTLRPGEPGDTLLLEVRLSGGCPGDAGATEPYLHPYYLHRIDERFLVLIDGVTAEVTGYRRR